MSNISDLVGGITQYNNGYLWLATNNGLYRYDGYRYKVYTHDLDCYLAQWFGLSGPSNQYFYALPELTK